MTKKAEVDLPAEYEETKAVFESDVMALEEISEFPSLRNLSPRDQMIMLATACGYSQQYIAKAYGISQQAIHRVVKKHDPTMSFRITPNAKKAFLTRILEGRTLEALSYITPEKMEVATAKELTDMASKFVNINQSMNQSKHKEVSGSRLDNIMAAIEQEGVEEAEIVADN